MGAGATLDLIGDENLPLLTEGRPFIHEVVIRGTLIRLVDVPHLIKASNDRLSEYGLLPSFKL